MTFQRDTAFRLALRLTMRRIAVTLAVVGALMFSAAGPASADFLSDVLPDTGLSKEATFEGVYCKGTGGLQKRPKLQIQ